MGKKPDSLSEVLFTQSSDLDLIYLDNLYDRTSGFFTLRQGISAELIQDTVRGSGLSMQYLTIQSKGEQPYIFSFEDFTVRTICPQYPGIMIVHNTGDLALWFPCPPYYRQYNSDGNIIIDTEIPLNFSFETEVSGVRLIINPGQDKPVELLVLRVDNNVSDFLKQLSSFDPIEDKLVGLYYMFRYDSIRELWNYLVRGNVFHVDYSTKDRLKCPCQQCANILYSYLCYLHRQTGKSIYSVLARNVAYSVLLSLPADGRWRHGRWADIMETHTRHQLDGIDLLLSAYEQTGMDVFIEKARLAMDYLISIADRLKDGNPWFLHDSLETNEQDRRLFYKRFLHSTAFGKSVSNTLCLNTHIWSLALLIRLARLGAGQRYLQIAEKGIEALRQVLSARPAEWSYKLIYGLRDMLLRLSVLTGRGGLSIKVYTNFMRKVLVPVCKKLFPRILMPNGYIERDLTSVHVSFIYFLVNLKDLLILYRYFPADWLKSVITRSVFYAHHSGFARFMARKDPRVRNFEDILLLAVAWLNDARFLSWLPEYMRLSGSKNYPLSADGLAHSAIADWKHTFGSSNPAVEVFTLAGPERPLLLLVNPTEKTQTVKLIPRYGSESVLTDMFNSTSAPVNARKEITLLPTHARLFCLLKESEAEKG